MPDGGSRLSLYLIRHGQTAWSVSGQHTGMTDLALTAQGEAEALRLRPVLSAVAFTHVLTSPLQRARRTCELAGLAPHARIDADLAEWNYGDYEGKRSRDGCPGGESPGQIAERADRFIAHLRTLTGNVALFTHGEFGLSLAVRWIGLAVAEGEHLLLGTASFGILGFNPAHPEVPVIARWNVAPP